VTVKKQTNNTPEPEILEPEEPPRKPTGRPSSYTQEVGDEICRLLSDGKALRDISQVDGFPHQATILRWVEQDAGGRFREQYTRARSHFYDRMAEECIRIADDSSQDFFIEDRNGKSVVVPDHARVHRDRLRVDARKWFLAKRDAKKYGERVEADSDSGPLSITWIEPDKASPVSPAPPALIEYKRPELPADLTEAEWGKLLQILEVAKRVAPSDSVPADVLEVIRRALLKHYDAEEKPAKPVVLKPRGRSGK
jgi:hypothetical protein